jgi:integrase
MSGALAPSPQLKLTSISLPRSARTMRGQLFDPREDIWAWRDAASRASLNFGGLRPLLSTEVLHTFKRVMLWMVENRATAGVNTDFDRFRSFFRFTKAARRRPITRISATDLLNYRGSLPQHVHVRTISRVSILVRRWHGMGLPGVSADAVALCKTLRHKNPVHSRAVRTHDTRMGPFTSIELDGLMSKLNQMAASGSLDEDHLVMTHIFIGLGVRTAQCALLKVCDVRRESYDGRQRYILRVPQVKKRHREERSEFRERVLPETLGQIVYRQARRICARFAKALEDPSAAPLLPARQGSAEVVPGYEYHSVAPDLRQTLKKAIAGLELYSERTGERLHITPIRFRRTFATRAAAAGWSPHAIAEALGHGNTDHEMVYVESVPDIAARIDRAVAAEMAPLAQAFAGTLIKDETEAIRGSDPASRIFDARIDRCGRPLGSCGQFAFCGFNAPLACYTCQHFQPWFDGPHEAVREYLLARRAELVHTTSEQIAQINDRRILAVEQVIQLCAQEKARRRESHG